MVVVSTLDVYTRSHTMAYLFLVNLMPFISCRFHFKIHNIRLAVSYYCLPAHCHIASAVIVAIVRMFSRSLCFRQLFESSTSEFSVRIFGRPPIASPGDKYEWMRTTESFSLSRCLAPIACCKLERTEVRQRQLNSAPLRLNFVVLNDFF